MKKIAPIIIALIVCSYLVTYIIGLGIVLLEQGMILGSIVILLVIIVIVGLIITMIYTLLKRLKEIDKEDQDDISKY